MKPYAYNLLEKITLKSSLVTARTARQCIEINISTSFFFLKVNSHLVHKKKRVSK